MRRPLLPLVLTLLTLFGAFADAQRRSGGGFGGSRSYRGSPSFRTPQYRPPTLRVPQTRTPGTGTFATPRARTLPRVAPRTRYRAPSYRSRGFSFFLPFFGFLPFFAFLPGTFVGSLLGGLVNLLLVGAVLMVLLSLLRRRRF